MTKREQPAGVEILCEHRVPSSSFCIRCEREKSTAAPAKPKRKGRRRG